MTTPPHLRLSNALGLLFVQVLTLTVLAALIFLALLMVKRWAEAL